MRRRRLAGTIFDEHSLDTFAGHIWQSVLGDECCLWMIICSYRDTIAERGVDEHASGEYVDQTKEVGSL